MEVEVEMEVVIWMEEVIEMGEVEEVMRMVEVMRMEMMEEVMGWRRWGGGGDGMHEVTG